MAILPIRLDRYMRGVPIVDRNGIPTLQEQAREQRNLEAVENAVNAVIDAQNAATAANAAAALANTAATAAQTAADNAQGAADEANATTAIANSYVSGVTITATDAGSNVTISISAHTRNYADGTNVSVNSGSIPALAYSTTYFIYYDQPSRAGGAVTYQATTSATTAAQLGDRHTVGSVTTPAAAGPPVTGDLVAPPGVGSILP